MIQRIRTGKTPAGSTSWQQLQGSSTTIYVDVNTSAAGFGGTPVYVTSLGGIGAHYVTTGASAVSGPTRTGFRVYINNLGGPITPEIANNNKWHVNWVGVEVIS